MKQNKIRKIISSLLIVVFVSAGMSFMPVEAGSSDIIIDNTTYAGELDNSVWNNPDGDILIENDTLIFQNTSSEYTRLITKKAVQTTTEIKELVTVDATMQFTSLPEGETFAIALGIKKIESMQGDSGNIEISFTNNGGLHASLIYYNEDGEVVTLAKAVRCGSMTGKNTIKVAVTTEQILTLSVGGKVIWTAELPVSGEGRVGFLQTGSCGVRLSNIRIESHLYDSPENCDIYEDFEKGGFNANLLTSKMRGASGVCWPSGTGIEQYNGSYVFRYTNAGESYIGTKYTYSNFELSFDVPYLQRQNVVKEDGSVVTSASNQFGISYGGGASDFDYAGYADAVTDVLWFTPNSTITSMKTGETVDAGALGYAFFSKEYDKGFSIKLTMYDSVVTVYMKWINESEYKKVFEYQTSTITPTGYLHIWANGPTNMAIDNIKIVNKDVNPQLLEVDYKTSIIEGPGDYEYQPMEKVYATVNEDKGFNRYLILPIVGSVCVIGLLTVVGIASMKNKKRRAGEKHEV